MRVAKNGVITSRNLKEYHIEPDGSVWEQCLYHNNPSVNLFSSSDSFATGVYKNDEMWFDFTRCKELSSFEFLYIQQTTKGGAYTKYRWVQTKSPFTATYADVSPSAVTRVTTSGYTDGGYGGLYYLGGNTYFVVANSNNGNWYGATGCWTAYQGGIPGYPNTTVTTGSVRVFVRVDVPKTKDYKANDVLMTNSIVEI